MGPRQKCAVHVHTLRPPPTATREMCSTRSHSAFTLHGQPEMCSTRSPSAFTPTATLCARVTCSLPAFNVHVPVHVINTNARYDFIFCVCSLDLPDKFIACVQGSRVSIRVSTRSRSTFAAHARFPRAASTCQRQAHIVHWITDACHRS